MLLRLFGITALLGIFYLCFFAYPKPEDPMLHAEKNPFTKHPERYSEFKTKQLSFKTVQQAYQEKEQYIGWLLKSKGIKGSFDLFLRAFKQEQVLEVWARNKGSKQYHHLIDYPFCNSSGSLGPKRIQGDQQIPEGAYIIDVFNPLSSYFLSMRVNYPNASDRILSDAQQPGGDIYFHGGCATVGCIPITDDKIKELYLLAVEAKDGGQEQISVHQFPFRLSERALEKAEGKHPQSLIDFWEQLSSIYDYFERERNTPELGVDQKGNYFLKP